MLLLAESYTALGGEFLDNAIDFYQQLVKARSNKQDQILDLYKKMAPLYVLQNNYIEAINC
jgi:hypothetical protein